MHSIERYRALCADGRTLEEQRSLNNQGRWKPSTIVRLEWECNGRPVEISHIYGLMAQLLPDHSGVAILRASVRSRFSPALELIEPDGRNRFTLESPIRIEAHDVIGRVRVVRRGRPSLAAARSRSRRAHGFLVGRGRSIFPAGRRCADRRHYRGDAAAVVAGAGYRLT